MALSQEDLCKHAVELELKELRTTMWSSEFVLALEPWLLDVYGMLRPRPCDYEQRAVLVKAFNMLAKDTFGADGGFPIVEAFGSFTMDLFTNESDLDLSINFSNDYAAKTNRIRKIAVLRKFTRFLSSVQRTTGHISKVLPILAARVPVVKVVDSGTGIECDVSTENKDGVIRSSILAAVSLIDERFRLLSYLMKAWAKAHDINSSKDRTINSLSIISFVAFHLQTRDPPILPPFSALFKDGTDVSSVQKAAVEFKNFGGRNEESLAKLFVTVLTKLSAAESLWPEGLCASTYEGSWIKKEWKKGKIGIMSIEDFLDRSENFARSVGEKEMKKINECINGSIKLLKGHMAGEIVETMLKERLFGPLTLNVSNNSIGTREPDLIYPIADVSNNSIREPDLIYPVADGSNNSIGLKRPIPFREPVTDNKRARYLEPSGERHHNFHLPNPPIPRNLQAPFQMEGRNDRYEGAQLGYGPQHNPQLPFTPRWSGGSYQSIPNGPIPPFQLRSSVEPSQSEYYNGTPFCPPWARGSQQQWQPPRAPHPDYGREIFQPPVYPRLGYWPHYHP